MRFLTAMLQALWKGWTAPPPARCCPACCINFAGFR